MPPNVKFEVDDCEEPWTYQQPFDFVHSRYMASAIKDWAKLARQCFRHTTPGGYCEFQDFDLQYYSEDGSMTPEAPISRWVNTLLKACREFGNDPHPGSKLGGWLEDAGFVDVKAEKFLVPIGPWAKDKHLVSYLLVSFGFIRIDKPIMLSGFPQIKQRRSSRTNEKAANPRLFLRKHSAAGTWYRLKTVSKHSVCDSTRNIWAGRLRRCKCFWPK